MTLQVKDGKLYADGIEVHPYSRELAMKAIVQGYSDGNLLQKFEGDYEVPLRVKEIVDNGGPLGSMYDYTYYAILEEVKGPEVTLPDAERILKEHFEKKYATQRFEDSILKHTYKDMPINAMHQYGNDLLSYLRKQVELTSDSRGRDVLEMVLTLIDKLKKP